MKKKERVGMAQAKLSQNYFLFLIPISLTIVAGDMSSAYHCFIYDLGWESLLQSWYMFYIISKAVLGGWQRLQSVNV